MPPLANQLLGEGEIVNKHSENQHGDLMRAETAEAIAVFERASVVDHSREVQQLGLSSKRAIYTVARGSSDAAANVISYELMRETGIAATSLPPSVFSLGIGVALDQAAVLVISQSGASNDLVLSAKGASANGAAVVAITNKQGSAVSAASHVTLPIGAGPELAVPATKTVIGSIAAGMGLIAAIKPEYRAHCLRSSKIVAAIKDHQHPDCAEISAELVQSEHVYVIGRDTGFGAAQEIALKLKECCALHAEAYSASEVLHGPLQLVTRRLTVLMLDTEDLQSQASLDIAEMRFRAAGCRVMRIRPSDVSAKGLVPAAAAAILIYVLYSIILQTALTLGFDPDHPDTLAKETLTI